MDLTIKNQTDNKLLSRNEVEASVFFQGATPSRKDIQNALAKELKAKPEMTIIRQIDTSFGNTKAKITANIYSDENAMKANERENLIEKHKIEEKAEEAAPEAATGAQEQEVPSESKEGEN